MHRYAFFVALFLAAGTARGAAPSISNEEIKKVVDGHLDDVKTCAKEHGVPQGKLVVEFAIEVTGKVVDSKPKQHSTNDKFDRCVAKAFTTWTFPKPRAAMAAVYPFVFSVPPPPKEGKLTEAQVVGTVQARQAETTACYNEAVKEKKDLSGVVRVAVVIAPSGTVSEAKVDQDTTGSAKLDTCLVERVKKWQFPKPEGGGEAAVRFPISFGSGAPAKEPPHNSQAVKRDGTANAPPTP